jgi:hypothetical protein
MKTLSIGITTFRNRLNDVKKQISDIRIYDKDIDILLAINTNFGEKMPETYRKDILEFCFRQNSIYPLMFPRFTGLAKMWNNLIVHCATTHIFLMNDDIAFNNPLAIFDIIGHIQNKEIFEINWGFGTFVISKKLAHQVGYFDERLIAYGEEDGDFIKRYSKAIEKIPIQGVMNRIQNRLEHSYDKNVETFIGDGGHKALVNKIIIEKKEGENWNNAQQYPYESFINDNYKNIGKVENIKYNEKNTYIIR